MKLIGLSKLYLGRSPSREAGAVPIPEVEGRDRSCCGVVPGGWRSASRKGWPLSSRTSLTTPLWSA